MRTKTFAVTVLAAVMLVAPERAGAQQYPPVDGDCGRCNYDFDGRLPIIGTSEILNASQTWRDNGGHAPRCDAPQSNWPRSSRQYRVLNLLTSYYQHNAEYSVELVNIGTDFDTQMRMDYWNRMWLPFYLDLDGWQAILGINNPKYRSSAAFLGYNWGMRWNYRQGTHLLSQIGLSGGGLNERYEQKLSNAFCIDALGNFRATTSRDMREKGEWDWLELGTDYSWMGPATTQRLLPKQTTDPPFPVGIVVVEDVATANRYADNFYNSQGNPRQEWLPNVSRWDVVAAPVITKTRVRVFPSRAQYERYVKRGPAGVIYSDEVVFNLELQGKVRRVDYVDARMGNDPATRGEGGHYAEAPFIARRTVTLSGWDDFTVDLVAAVTSRSFATADANDSWVLGDPSIIPPAEEFVPYDNEEYELRIREACKRRTGYDCEMENPLAADSIIPAANGICPSGYRRVAVDTKSQEDWNWLSEKWTRENYERIAGCSGSDCRSSSNSTFNGTTVYVCQLMSETERRQQSGGDRGQTSTQSREDRLECRRTGQNCPANNNLQRLRNGGSN